MQKQKRGTGFAPALFFCVRVVLDMRPDPTRRFKIINYVLRYAGVSSIVSVLEQIFDKQKNQRGNRALWLLALFFCVHTSSVYTGRAARG